MPRTKNILKTLIGLGMLAAFALTVVPHLRSYVSADAVVNAPIREIKTPFEGHLTLTSPDVATFVRKGQVVFEIHARAPDTFQKTDAAARLLDLQGRIDSGQQKLKALTQAYADLEGQIATALLVAQNRAQAKVAQAQANVEMQRVDVAQTQTDFDRIEETYARGVTTEVEYNDAQAQLNAAKASLDQAQATLRVRRSELRAISQKASVDGDTTGLSSLQMRFSDLKLQIETLKATLNQLRTERDSVELRLASAKSDLEKRSVYRYIAPSNGIVWSPTPKKGDLLDENEIAVELLDCEQRFVEVYMSDRNFDNIGPEDVGHIRLMGAHETIESDVYATRGSLANMTTYKYAVNRTPDRGDREKGMTARMPLPSPDFDNTDTVKRFCDVGRAAEVKIGNRTQDQVTRITTALNGALTSLFH